MKANKFVKALLVIIAVLLLLDCVKDSGSGGVSIPFLDTKAVASVPAFIQVGKSYSCTVPALVGSMGGNSKDFTVASIDKDGGWIQAKDGTWQNMSHYHRCEETK